MAGHTNWRTIGTNAGIKGWHASTCHTAVTAGRTHLLADDGHRREESLDLVVADQALVVGVAELVNHGVSHA